MIKFRPIDEELKCLHEPVAVTISEEDDNDSALDGFRVTNSGSVMIPSGLTKPFMARRPSSTASTLSTSHSSSMTSYPPTPQPHHDSYYQQNYQSQLHLQLQQFYQYQQQQQQLHHMQQQQLQYQQAYYSNSLPQSLPRYQGGYARPVPSSLPSSFPEQYSHQHAMAPPQHPFCQQGVFPFGMPPMGMDYSQYHQGYNQHHYPYPTGY